MFNFPKIKILILALIAVFACLPIRQTCLLIGQLGRVFAQENPEEKPASDFRIIFRGSLLDSQGNPVADGNYNMKFRIYAIEEALAGQEATEQVLWEEDNVGEDKIAVSAGKFQATLGRKQKLALDFENNVYWLGVTVGGQESEPVWDQEMKPRKKIVSLKKLLEELEEKEKKKQEEIFQEEALIKQLFEKMGDSGDYVVLLDAGSLKLILEQLSKKEEMKSELDQFFPEELLNEQNLFDNTEDSQTEQEGIGAKIINFFKNALAAIEEKLDLILTKIGQIFDALADISSKVTAIYNVIVKGENPQTVQNNPSLESVEKLPEGGLEEKQDSGRYTIYQGESYAVVSTEKIEENSQIFISFDEKTPFAWWISERVEGKYFVITAEKPADQHYAFNWWVTNSQEAKQEENLPGTPSEAGENVSPEKIPEPTGENQELETNKEKAADEVPAVQPQENSENSEELTPAGSEPQGKAEEEQGNIPQTEEKTNQGAPSEGVALPVEDTITEGQQMQY